MTVDRGLGLEGCVGFVTVDVGEVSASARERNEAQAGRKPTDVAKLSGLLLGVVRARARPWSFEWLLNVWLGNRRFVGAGGAYLLMLPSWSLVNDERCHIALTYVAASRLPNVILDFMLALPYHLQTLRSSLSPSSPPLSPTPARPLPDIPLPRPVQESSAHLTSQPSIPIVSVVEQPSEQPRHFAEEALLMEVVSLPNSEPVSDAESPVDVEGMPKRSMDESWVSLREDAADRDTSPTGMVLRYNTEEEQERRELLHPPQEIDVADMSVYRSHLHLIDGRSTTRLS